MSGTLRSPTRAIEHWRRYLTLRPDDRETAARLAESLVLLGKWQQAAEWGERLGDGVRAQMLRARLLLESDPERAEAALAAAFTAQSETGESHHRLEALAARVYHQNGDPENAALHARRAIELDPLDLQSTYLLARLRQRLGDAVAAGERLATHQLLAQLTGAGSLPEPASAEGLRLLLEIEPRAHGSAIEFRLEKLRRLVANGRRDEARPLLAALTELPQLTPARRLELVGLADKLGDFDRARALLETVLGEEAAAANHREALYGLAVFAHRTGDRPRVRELVAEGLERFPHAARFHHLLGRVELADGDSEAAAAGFRRALELAPWKSDCRIDLANLFLSEERLDDVGALLAEVPETDPALDAYRRRYGL